MVCKNTDIVLGTAHKIYAAKVFAERQSCYINLGDLILLCSSLIL
jgi:hypothetical protein